MIVGTGVDIVEVARVQAALQRYGKRFAARLFTPAEITYCERFAMKAAERYAARFAAKEAAFKALGVGWHNGIRWLDVEVTHQPNGRPELTLHGKARELGERLGVATVLVSLSHADRYAVAQVILESNVNV